MDLNAVRTFVTAAETGQFSEAADALSITQQAVSKRIAALEKYLDVRLFARTPRGAQLTIDGQAFLPHARELVRVADRADAAVRPGRRALRIDIVARRIITSTLLHDFHRANPGIDLDIITLDADLDGAVAAVDTGTIDATFHAVPTHYRLPESIRTARIIDEPHQLLVGPRHPLANARTLTPHQLSGHRIWMPGLPAHGEVAEYFTELTTTFDLTIDRLGPVFAKEALLEEISESTDLATLIGEGTRFLWPDSYDLRRIPVRNPALIYPLSIIWRADNRHPALAALRDFLDSRSRPRPGAETWIPQWAQPISVRTRERNHLP
ncbi:LysR family transcriptional regulator [Nocardia sp. NPDC056100]|uniref:LysR family transcriptional regulator n=1 Tax=Nocardia sp. NPDC056100 TaxID=3345712 RepID=UPI0035DCC3C4